MVTIEKLLDMAATATWTTATMTFNLRFGIMEKCFPLYKHFIHCNLAFCLISIDTQYFGLYNSLVHVVDLPDGQSKR